MPRKSQAQPDVPPFEYRPGVGGFPPFGGMYRRGDPSQVPVDRLHLGINIRLASELVSRPGLAQVGGTQEDACITGMFDIADESVAIYIAELGNGGLDSDGVKIATPFQIMSFNEDKEAPPDLNFWDGSVVPTKAIPEPYRVPVQTGALAGTCIRSFQRLNGRILTHDGTKFYDVTFSEDAPTLTGENAQNTPREDSAFVFDASTVLGSSTIQSMCVRPERFIDQQNEEAEVFEVLYIGAKDGKIARWDGRTVELVHTSSAGGKMDIISWSLTGLVAAGDTGFAYQQTIGSAWTEVTWPTGLGEAGPNFNCNGLAEWSGEIAFMGDWHNEFGGGIYGAWALRWSLTGGFNVLYDWTPLDTGSRLRSPFVSIAPSFVGTGNSLRLCALKYEFQNGATQTPPLSADCKLWTWKTDWSTGRTSPLVDVIPTIEHDTGFAIPYGNGVLVFTRSGLGGDPDKDRMILVEFPGDPDDNDNMRYLYEWDEGSDGNPPLDGSGYEAISL